MSRRKWRPVARMPNGKLVYACNRCRHRVISLAPPDPCACPTAPEAGT
jgi:hypothetical protein